MSYEATRKLIFNWIFFILLIAWAIGGRLEIMVAKFMSVDRKQKYFSVEFTNFLELLCIVESAVHFFVLCFSREKDGDTRVLLGHRDSWFVCKPGAFARINRNTRMAPWRRIKPILYRM